MTTTEAARPEQPAAPEAIVAVPVRHPGRWVAAVILVVLAAMFVHGLVTNPAWKWDTVGQYLFSGQVLDGLLVTIELTLLAMVIGVVLGIVVAVMRLSTNPIVSGIAWLYAWFFRGTPVLVQIVFWSFIGLLYRYPGLGIPFGPTFVYFDANQLIPVFVGATLGLGLNEAAYMSEIVRAGILSVHKGQMEAGASLGLSRGSTLRLIVVPQALRVILPPLTNQYLNLTKNSSLAVAIGYPDLFSVFAGTTLSQTGQAIEIIAITMGVYLLISLVTSAIMSFYGWRIGRSLGA